MAADHSKFERFTNINIIDDLNNGQAQYSDGYCFARVTLDQKNVKVLKTSKHFVLKRNFIKRKLLLIVKASFWRLFRTLFLGTNFLELILDFHYLHNFEELVHDCIYANLVILATAVTYY